MNIKQNFDRHGFAILPAFFPVRLIDAALENVQHIKSARPFDIVVDMLESGERTSLGLLSLEDVITRRMKINDLHLSIPEVRALALENGISSILRDLLGHTPVLCNSLYFEKGSAQPAHVDSLYMTPATPQHLIAIWVALEDTQLDAGPLEYYPGSHLIEQMKFSDGSYHHIPEEMPDWHAYIDDQVKEKGLKKSSFAARKGDVFIWHSDLLHGGGRIKNPQLTRKSLVFHYYSETDCRARGENLVPHSGVFWQKRAPQKLPASAIAKMPFVEEAYLMRYPDVAAAVKSGSFASGAIHFTMYGCGEGRIPA
jgi:ectoine hydroxylase-related dioxygenase (phytanoyl-CoA dioxygenase family)